MNMQRNLFKLTLFGVMLLISHSSFSQITERERPAEWKQLVKGARFMDRFLPMKGNVLSSDTWGADCVLPRYVDNGIEDGGEISEKAKTVNIIYLSVAGWNVHAKDTWNGLTHTYFIP